MSNYWLDVAVADITTSIPEGKIVISSGISPSANYHIGHYREILTAEALAWGLRQSGREVEHIHVVDDMDPLRKRYDFLPPKFEQYVGWPICFVPSPEGKGSYADHFLNEFTAHFGDMGIAPDRIVRSYQDLYRSGAMSTAIEQVLEHLDEVRDIFARYGRELPRDWAPLQVLGEDKQLHTADPSTWDKATQTLAGADYTAGEVKLNWRLDWPARWAVLGVDVEPFSAQEHGAAGGSYDTGVEFTKQIFNHTPPLPGARYGNVHLAGETKKMSSSKGNIITPGQAMAIIPPSILRYFIVRSRPEKAIYFDPGNKLLNLIDEYKQVAADTAVGKEHEFSEAYRFADLGDRLSDVPFTHLVSVYQAALGDIDIVMDILRRGDFEVERDVLRRELDFVANWLQTYAPEAVKFSLQEELPTVELTDAQTSFLAELADKIAERESLDAEWVHATIYDLKETHQLSPAQSFRAIYQVLLGKNSGPKAGWFLATIDKDWLIRRLKLQA